MLEAAYDDSAGVTAEFNRNVLRVINRELDADFDVDAFEHVAFFDREREWIEMRLRAERRMDVHVGRLGLDVSLRAARGAAHGDQRQVHDQAPGRRPGGRPASSCATSSPTPTSSSRCRSAPAQGDDGAQPRALAAAG